MNCSLSGVLARTGFEPDNPAPPVSRIMRQDAAACCCTLLLYEASNGRAGARRTGSDLHFVWAARDSNPEPTD